MCWTEVPNGAAPGGIDRVFNAEMAIGVADRLVEEIRSHVERRVNCLGIDATLNTEDHVLAEQIVR